MWAAAHGCLLLPAALWRRIDAVVVHEVERVVVVSNGVELVSVLMGAYENIYE